ncbi:MAG: hypothetical protein DVB22_002231 [Verrucomicrobia bacterium]|nr:MAG: hypothetical protein DVB22_002231 [Verrucomicrobiota bacterium]
MFGMIAKLNHDGTFRSRGWGVNPPVGNSPPGLIMGGPSAGLLVFRGGSKLGWEENRGEVWETGKPKGDDACPAFRWWRFANHRPSSLRDEGAGAWGPRFCGKSQAGSPSHSGLADRVRGGLVIRG